MSQPSGATRRRRIRYLAAAGACVAALASTGALIAVPASAATSPNTTTSRRCGPATISLQLQHSDPGRIEAGFEIDHATVNSVWRVHLRHNGETYFRGQRTAAAPDGSFSVDRVLPNLGGIDTVSGTARNVATGQVCAISGRV